MAWKTGTIKLAAAKSVFSGVDFSEIKVGGSTVGYTAKFKGSTLEDTSLTTLCKKLWSREAG